ncbi:MAG: hypothetical protein LBJ00_05310 [Planctomycetaceae bacterium]|nr:hypothetical protein [Planctomycetaceae bacterium]
MQLMAANVRLSLAHDHLVDGGTTQRRNRRGANRGSVTPRPFIQPALDAIRLQAEAILERAIQRAFDSVEN